MSNHALAPLHTPHIETVRRLSSLPFHADMVETLKEVWELPDEKLIIIWQGLCEDLHVTCNEFCRSFSINKGNFNQYKNGHRPSRRLGVEGRYAVNANRLAIVAWIASAWTRINLLVDPTQFAKVIQSCIESEYSETPNAEDVTVDAIINIPVPPPLEIDESPTILFDPSAIAQSAALYDEILRSTGRDAYRVLLFVDYENVGNVLVSLHKNFCPERISSRWPVCSVSVHNGFGPNKLKQKAPVVPWNVNIVHNARSKNISDFILMAEVRSFIDKCVASPAFILERPFPLLAIVVSNDSAIAEAVVFMSEIVKYSGLSSRLTLRNWPATSFSLPLALFFSLPDIGWNSNLSPLLRLAHQNIRDNLQSNLELPILDRRSFLLACEKLRGVPVPYFVYTELFQQRGRLRIRDFDENVFLKHPFYLNGMRKTLERWRTWPAELSTMVPAFPPIDGAGSHLRLCLWRDALSAPGIQEILHIRVVCSSDEKIWLHRDPNAPPDERNPTPEG
jgi:hypothetical protein